MSRSKAPVVVRPRIALRSIRATDYFRPDTMPPPAGEELRAMDRPGLTRAIMCPLLDAGEPDAGTAPAPQRKMAW
jgi:hypothetical protein